MPSIAIIGASNNKNKFGNKCVRAYQSIGWKVFPINTKENNIEGLKCYQSITQLPYKPDRVSIYLPPNITISLIPELLKAKIKNVILNPGAESEELIKALHENGIKTTLACSIRLEGLNPDDFP
jgi:hypothetical protein